MTNQPLQDITFVRRPFYINSAVHTPRESTEFITEAGYIPYLQQLGRDDLVVADVGTGSGVTAVSWALECPGVARVYGVDLYSDALVVAARNVERYEVGGVVKLVQGDGFEPLLDKPVDVIIANLPCASDAQIVYMREHGKLRDEPLESIHGGETGFELYERLFGQLKSYRYMDGVSGIWMFGCTDHLGKMEHYRRTQFPEFELRTFRDKYKPYFLHGLLTRVGFEAEGLTAS